MRKSCKICGRAAAPNRSRCAACYRYYREHRQERPLALWSRTLSVDRGSAPAWCEVCGDIRIDCGGKCNACYGYWIKHRRKRPRYWWDVDAVCKTCRIPLASVGRYRTGRPRWIKGHCPACYRYKERTGKARPRHLWGIGEHGWCDCGFPAVAIVSKDIPVCERHRE